MQEISNDINSIINRINYFKIEPAFSAEIKRRIENKPPDTISKNELLEIFVRLIAFSQQASSEKVKTIIDQKLLGEILEQYDVLKVAQMNPCDLAEMHFAKVSGIRQQAKFFHIIMFARLLQRDNTVLDILTNPPIPKVLETEADIIAFWKGFNLLQRKMKSAKAPFLRGTTTLLHFLLDLGYDCIKPDSAVMKASNKIRLVENQKGKNNLVKTVRFIQTLALQKGIRPCIFDLYLLIEGGQTEASKLVDKEYYNTN